MHNIDRTQLEFDPEQPYFESGHEPLFESDPETFEFDEYGETSAEAVFSESDEIDLASELLAVSHEEELDQFLGKLIRRVGRTVGRVVRSPIGRAVGGLLRNAARTALPMAGRALGTMIAPGLGTAAGGALGQAAANVFGLEVEGLSAEDQQFEVARRYIRFAGDAVKNATAMPGQDPKAIAAAAVMQAANKYAPGLVPMLGGQPRTAQRRYVCNCQKARKGQWLRKGNTIVLLNM